MKEGFRQSMAWLHTWSGLLVGWVLFLVFCAGTASYFKEEITFWMKPELHRAAARPVSSVAAAERAVAYLQTHGGAESPRWFINLPGERQPMANLFWAPKPQPPVPGADKPRRARFSSALIDPGTGEKAEGARATRGGEFLYRLHYDLHYINAIWARWIVSFCALFMLTAILSGIVTHRRIFQDFFTFRPRKGQRSWLDAHNATAVLALPYHLMITYTGLVTLMLMWMPWSQQAAYRGDVATFQAEMFPDGGGAAQRVPPGVVPLVPVRPLVEQAQRHWGEGAQVGRIVVSHPNTAAASIVLSRRDGGDLSSDQPTMRFDGATGALLSTTGDEPRPAARTRGVLYGLHLAHFSNPFLRALFFVSGLAGCVMVATGLLLWGVKERQKYAKALQHGGRIGFGLRLVEGLNLAAIAGLPIAFASYFWANRLLPVGLDGRAQAEITCFFAAWGVAAVAGLAWPSRRMWQLQLWIGAVLFCGVPVMNALTTGSNLWFSLRAGMWDLAGFELVNVALGLCLAVAAWYAGRRKPHANRPRTAVPSAAARLETAP
ncbi:PepSY domain-containing protein [Xylophilus sp. Kf1]|nr:PepSY domain-containing protein [Xylophilus sp. Kf1]